MKYLVQIGLIISLILVPNVYIGAQESSAPIQDQNSPTQNESVAQPKRVVVSNKSINPLNQSDTVSIPSKNIIQRKKEEIILLKKLMHEIEEPKEGVDELIRQEKMRLLIERVNRNLGIIEEARKDQEKQMQIIDDQRAVLEQTRNLPKR